MNPVKRLWALGQVLKAGWVVFRDPNRLDAVFGVADDLGEAQPQMLQDMADHFRQDVQGRWALEARPRLGVLDVNVLSKMPAGTFGHEAAKFLRARGLDPANLPQRPSTNEIEFLQAHLYETHDLWHVVTGFDTDVAGELGLQAFYAAQVPGKLPWALLAIGMLNTVFFAFEDRMRRLEAMAAGWRMGRAAKSFFGVDWRAQFERPIAELRGDLKVQPMVLEERRQAQLAAVLAQAA